MSNCTQAEIQKAPDFALLFSLLLLALSCPADLRADQQQPDQNPISSDLPIDAVPDIRNDETKLKLQKKNFVVVPIPTSSPTFGTGLIVGGAYFYRQTEEQEKTQPASFTGAAAAYTNSTSYGFGIMQQNYWSEDRWRFTGVAGYADLELELLGPVGSGSSDLLDWFVKGDFIQTTISRKLAGPWFLGLQARYLDITQDLDLNLGLPGFDLQTEIESVGLGLAVERDTRDMPTNAYNGRQFEVNAMFSETSQLNVESYQSYYVRFRSYHELQVPVVIAWAIDACRKSGKMPLWDTCRLNLRGFPATRYLGRESLSGQVEARWRAHKKWGMVAFVGGGYVGTSFSDASDRELVPSYGVGLRYMVLESKRINLRLDYARSDNSDAWYVSATEAF